MTRWEFAGAVAVASAVLAASFWVGSQPTRGAERHRCGPEGDQWCVSGSGPGSVELWREGPVVIEAQDRGSSLEGVDWAQPVMTVDRAGTVWRLGRHLSALSREELVQLVRELASYEVQRSRPPASTQDCRGGSCVINPATPKWRRP